MRSPARAALAVSLLASLSALAQPAPPVPPDAFAALHWRSVGPLRGGRTKSALGIPGRPGSFLLGAVNGGVFRSDDYGRTWTPIFDAQPTASIGALAISPAAPDTIYVGSGEGMHRPDLSVGDGVYKSVDGGKTFRHLGLDDAQQIPQIAVDPRDANRLFVAVLGHPYGPNEQRGLYRSLDGGASFQKVLGDGPDTGAVDVVLDPQNPDVVYAALWEAREAPWENGHFNGPGSGLFKSTDGGAHFQRIGRGLPGAAEGLGRIGLGIAPSRPSRLFATVQAKKNAGLYRTDDGGESWTLVNADERFAAERADDAAEVKVHPKNPDVVFTAVVVLWKSTDGGRTFAALRGAPGGDDYQRVWIDPERPDTMIVGSDQGAIVTVNGGATFSSWYNQSTAQMFHVNADEAFPYRLCGGQQESGSACVSSRGIDGAITVREWHPVGVEEYGYAVPDPRDPDSVFGGKVSRYDRRTAQTEDLSPVAAAQKDYRVIRTQPLVFSPVDPKTLYFASNTVWRTRDGGRHWDRISPDLSRRTWAVPAPVGKYAREVEVERRGVVYALAPSPLDAQLLWAGTDDGLLHVTRDGGKTWTDVTPPSLAPWAKVSILEASHFDKDTAYAAVNTLRLDDPHPHVLRTRDGGRTWSEIVAGLPASAPVDVVREDPKRRGLLFCGTERTVHVSFDDGERWQPLRLNLPATSVRDLIVKGDDLAIATHGRGFWILDDLEPLRQQAVLAGNQPALLKPADAVRARWNTNTDTPLPPDEPMAENPPDGAILDYVLPAPARAVSLEIADASGAVLRTFRSDDPVPPPADEGNIPRWWPRPATRPLTAKGLHRFVWDLHATAPAAAEPAYPIAAVPHDTPKEPRGAWVLPGVYTVRLVVDGRSSVQPLRVRPDPRVKTPAAGLSRQWELSQRLARGIARSAQALAEVRAAKTKLGGKNAALDAKLLELGEGIGTPERFGPPPAPSLARWNARLSDLFTTAQAADVDPTPQLVAEAGASLAKLDELLARWRTLSGELR